MEISQGWHALAIVSLVIAALCAAVVIVDLASGHRQHMAIMNVVWPVTCLWAGPVGLWAYFRVGRLGSHRAMHEAKERGEKPPAQTKPFWQSTGVAATHCGAGCSLGDIVAEWFVFFVPVTLWGQKVFGTWAIDFACAFLFGIVFQYFSIVPMKKLSPGAGLIAALKADTLSLTAWQIGMYGWMALVVFVWWGDIPKTEPLFWFMMQVAMAVGFLTSYPVNAWLLRLGIKEKM